MTGPATKKSKAKSLDRDVGKSGRAWVARPPHSLGSLSVAKLAAWLKVNSF
ncbi:MAG: hypothetical protein U0930_01725 [Pirellulales bacterium]